MKIKRYVKWGGISAAFSVLMIVLCHIYWNMSFTHGIAENEYHHMAKWKDVMDEHPVSDQEVAVNVAYDKVLVPYSVSTESDGEKINDIVGVTDIVDRAKLVSLMKMLKELDNYRYIVCDVELTEEYQTESDSELFSLISSMRDIVVPDSDSLPACLRPVAAKARYSKKRVGDDFMKYTCIDEGQETMAFRMWKDMTGGTYEPRRMGIIIDGKHCLNYFVPHFRYMIYDKYKKREEGDVGNELTMYNLGHDILSGSPDDNMSLFKDKILLIGAWDKDDIHDTPVGPQPGISIVYNAYLSLLNRDNYISLGMYGILFLIFWLLNAFTLRGLYMEESLSMHLSRAFYRVRGWLCKNCRMDDYSEIEQFKIPVWLSLLLSMLSYSTVLIIIMAVFYFRYNLYINAVIVGSLMSLIGELVSAYKKE